MGKRELLLILCFVIIGAVVYQATAPPADPNAKTFSFGRLVDAARREIRGNRAATDIASTTKLPLDPEVSELRVVGYIAEVSIVGEDRSDVEVDLRVHSRAYDDAEAKRYGEETVLKPDRAATTLTLQVQYPLGRRSGRQRASISVRLPSRMRARIESRPGKLSMSNIAAAEITNAGGDTEITHVSGRVAITQRGGNAKIEDVGRLKLTGRGAEIKVTGVSQDASIALEQGGEMVASKIAGPLDVESRNAEVTLENLESTRGPIRVSAINGTVTMKGVQADTRVDGRQAGLDVVMSGAAAVSIYSDGEDVALTPPPAPFRLDAVVIDGRIEADDAIKKLGIEIATDAESKESHAAGVVRGGGPTVTIRTTRGDLTLRPAAAAARP